MYIQSYTCKLHKTASIEIKSAMAWNRGLARNIDKFQKTVNAAEAGYLLYASVQCPESEAYPVRHFKKGRQLCNVIG